MNNEYVVVIYTSSFPIVVEILTRMLPREELYENELFVFNNVASIGLFSLFLYNHYGIQNNIYQIALCVVYLQYVCINTFYNHSIVELELIKRIMWLYATPIMANQYCKLNNLHIWNDIKFQYFIAALLITFLPHYKQRVEIFGFAFVPLSYFFYSLYKFIHLQHTKTFIQVWCIFCIIGTIEYFNLISYNKIVNISFIFDSLAKGVWLFALNDYQLNHNFIANDIQSVHLLSTIMKSVDNFIKNKESNVTLFGISNNIKSVVLSHFPTNNSEINSQLLQSILPYNFDQSYIMESRSTKHYAEIAVLMTDIVGYSELANKYSEETVYFMLNDMYIRFDKIIQQYNYLQKIETIGDAYMVVGDLTMGTQDSSKIVEQLISVGTQFIREIKEIHIIGGLQIRIGISLGPVVIGILGNAVPRLSVVGNTVNMAARLQSSTQPDCICLSEKTYCAVKREYPFTINHGVELKNIGCVTTYTLSV